MAKRTFLFFLLFTLAITGCSTPPKTQEANQSAYPPAASDPSSGTSAQTDANGYPSPAQERPTQYAAAYPTTEPTPHPMKLTPVVVPTPDANTGVITGIVFNKDTKGAPLQFSTVKVGIKLFLTPGPGYTYGIAENASPEGLSDANGKFAISNVKPGTYLLFIWSPQAASVIIDPKTGKELEINVEAGKVIDVGEVEAPKP